MINIELYISSGSAANHRFLIDNEPLDPQIDVANHVHQAFDTWKETIFDELAEVCNDYFSVTAHCTIEQFTELQYYALRCSLCKKCSHVASGCSGPDQTYSPTDDSEHKPAESNEEGARDFRNIQKRLEELHKAGVTAPLTKLEFGFYISSDCESMRHELWESFASRGFDTRFLSTKMPFFNVMLQEIEDDEAEYYENDYFAFASEKSTGTQPAFIDSEPATFADGVLAFICNKYLIPFINEHHKPVVVTRMEDAPPSKTYSISLPQRLYVGDRVPLCIKGATYLAVKDELEFVCSAPNVIRFSDGQLLAISPGTANICIRIKGSLDNIVASEVVSVSEHVYVKAITISSYPDYLYVGDEFYLSIECVPSYAENAKDIKITSANGRVLTVTEIGKVVAKKAGVGILDIVVGEVHKTLEIVVKERLNSITLPQNEVSGYLGVHIPFEPTITPSNYTVDDLTISSDNMSVATYENGEIIIRGIGNSKIQFQSKYSDVKSEVHVNGLSTFMKKNYRDIPVQIGIVLFLLTMVTSFFDMNLFFCSLAGALLCLVSLVIDKRSRLFSAIFALLNAAVTYILICGSI